MSRSRSSTTRSSSATRCSGSPTLDQLRKLHIDPSRVPADRRFDIFDVDIDAIIRKAVDLRERLATEIDDDDPGPEQRCETATAC
jgi:hypothetical protein